MFRTSWFRPQGDSCISSMVCFVCIGVSSLVDRRVYSSLEHVENNNKLNIKLENCAFRWFVLYNNITMQGAKKKKLLCTQKKV